MSKHQGLLSVGDWLYARTTSGYLKRTQIIHIFNGIASDQYGNEFKHEWKEVHLFEKPTTDGFRSDVKYVECTLFVFLDYCKPHYGYWMLDDDKCNFDEEFCKQYNIPLK